MKPILGMCILQHAGFVGKDYMEYHVNDTIPNTVKLMWLLQEWMWVQILRGITVFTSLPKKEQMKEKDSNV